MYKQTDITHTPYDKLDNPLGAASFLDGKDYGSIFHVLTIALIVLLGIAGFFLIVSMLMRNKGPAAVISTVFILISIAVSFSFIQAKMELSDTMKYLKANGLYEATYEAKDVKAETTTKTNAYTTLVGIPGRGGHTDERTLTYLVRLIKNDDGVDIVREDTPMFKDVTPDAEGDILVTIMTPQKPARHYDSLTKLPGVVTASHFKVKEESK